MVLDEHESWPPGAPGAPGTPLQSFCRWLQPRLAGVEELRLALDATRLLPMAQPPCLPADLLLLGTVGEAAAAAAAGPLPLAKLSIQWHGSAALGWGPRATGLPLRNLRKLAFPGGTRLWVDGSLPAAEGERVGGCALSASKPQQPPHQSLPTRFFIMDPLAPVGALP